MSRPGLITFGEPYEYLLPGYTPGSETMSGDRPAVRDGADDQSAVQAVARRTGCDTTRGQSPGSRRGHLDHDGAALLRLRGSSGEARAFSARRERHRPDHVQLRRCDPWGRHCRAVLGRGRKGRADREHRQSGGLRDSRSSRSARCVALQIEHRRPDRRMDDARRDSQSSERHDVLVSAVLRHRRTVLRRGWGRRLLVERHCGRR